MGGWVSEGEARRGEGEVTEAVGGRVVCERTFIVHQAATFEKVFPFLFNSMSTLRW